MIEFSNLINCSFVFFERPLKILNSIVIIKGIPLVSKISPLHYDTEHG